MSMKVNRLNKLINHIDKHCFLIVQDFEQTHAMFLMGSYIDYLRDLFSLP